MGLKFTVYKTVNLVNSRYYLGAHQTDNPNDDYLGSGKLLLRAVAKYGKENFKKEVLFLYENAKEMFEKEFELTEACKNDPLCYNLRQGGSGGFDWINKNQKNGAGRSKAGKITWQRHGKEIAKNLEKGQAIVTDGRYGHNLNRGYSRNFTSDQREVQRQIATGRVWITNGLETRFVRLTIGLPEGWQLGRVILPFCAFCKMVRVKVAGRKYCSSSCAGKAQFSK